MGTWLVEVPIGAEEALQLLQNALDGVVSSQDDKQRCLVLLSCGTNQPVGCSFLPLPPCDAQELRERFGLSKAQARIALLIAARLTNVEIARVVQTTVGTVRKHVEWIFVRLNVRRREEVLYILSGSVEDSR